VKFEVGDLVVYPSQGAGVVQERTTREVLGETHEYLKVVFVKGDMEVLVPLRRGQEVGLRHTIGVDEVDQLFDALAKADLNLPVQWPPRYRVEQEILARGGAYELARLIGVLARRDLEKGLAATEREVLDTAKSMLGVRARRRHRHRPRRAMERLDAVVAERVSAGRG
jgi:CarD family transcriptional regulator